MLKESGNPLSDAGETVQAQLRAQLLAVIDEAADATALPSEHNSGLSTAIGRDRAASGIHPSASLAAANTIFAAALADLTSYLDQTGVPSAQEAAALRLNAAILRRMADAAANYVSYLLEKAGTAHHEEARRLSRELHDAVGPMVANGIQNLDLIEYWNRNDPERAQRKIDESRDGLREAMALIRSLAAETRLSVEPHQICDALRQHLAGLPNTIKTDFRTNNDLAELPPHYGNEMFLILREALRNAASHGSPTAIAIDIDVAGTTFVGTVSDDGKGFDPSLLERAGTGISSMSERAALIGATLEIDSSPQGTQMTLTVPLPVRMTP